MSTAERDPNTAAAIVLLLGAIAELESGESIAIKVVSDDDNDDGRWRIAVDLAAPEKQQREADDDRSIERLPARERERCPLCTAPTFDPTTKTCTHCDFRDG